MKALVDTLLWWQQSQSETARRTLAELQRESLRFLLVVAGLAYAVWHVGYGLLLSQTGTTPAALLRIWSLATVVTAGIAVGGVLIRWRARLAAPSVLTLAVLMLVGASWLLQAPLAVRLLPIVALSAVVLLHPLAGLVTAGLAVALVGLLQRAGPLAFLADAHIAEIALTSFLTVAAAWTLARNLVVAVEWSTTSYAEAARHAQEARVNRGELVQALKQLDLAYYRIQRANAALELAWKAADAAERAKSEFVTSISHELRTPLNLIIGFSELILNAPESYRAPLPAEYRGDLNAIYRSAQHLLTLTNDVIDLARVGMNRLALVREPVDLAQVVTDAGALVREYLQAKSLWLRIEVEPDLPRLSLDRLRIRQVLLNLLTNAARFTEQGGVTIHVRQVEAAVQVDVIDTGVGIAPAELPRLFEEFHHEPGADAHQADGFGGVGLGLPLSRRLVELHGGRLGVESALGRGTTFWFTLPTAPTAIGAPAPAPLPVRAPTGSGERLLVLAGVDEPVAEFLGRQLSGYRVVAVPDLAQATAAAAELRALAIIADESADQPATAMPVPLIRLPLPQGDRLATRLEIAAYLVKPITPTRLQATLARLDRPLRTVLVVDDDLRFARLLARMVRAAPAAAGCVVVTAPNGQAALEALAHTRPDLVLVDMVMPRLDGPGLVAAMRASPALAAIPVIIVSAQDQLTAWLPLHGQLSLVHPEGFGLEDLIVTLEALLNGLRPPQGYLSAPTEPA
jgi:signal transduction histidine kinase/CheY-like chemotaxis protein